jgi:hypothetical protein
MNNTTATTVQLTPSCAQSWLVGTDAGHAKTTQHNDRAVVCVRRKYAESANASAGDRVLWPYCNPYCNPKQMHTLVLKTAQSTASLSDTHAQHNPSLQQPQQFNCHNSSTATTATTVQQTPSCAQSWLVGGDAGTLLAKTTQHNVRAVIISTTITLAGE